MPDKPHSLAAPRLTSSQREVFSGVAIGPMTGTMRDGAWTPCINARDAEDPPRITQERPIVKALARMGLCGFGGMDGYNVPLRMNPRGASAYAEVFSAAEKTGVDAHLERTRRR